MNIIKKITEISTLKMLNFDSVNTSHLKVHLKWPLQTKIHVIQYIAAFYTGMDVHIQQCFKKYTQPT